MTMKRDKPKIEKDMLKLFEARLGAFIFNEKNQLLILKNKKGTWGIVGGHLKYNETPEEGLIREIKEETNIKVKLITCLNVVVNTKEIIFRYVAKYVNGNVLLSNEHDDWKWVNLNDLNKYNLTFNELKEDARKSLKVFKSKREN
ncbi:MAG: NUDIX hydrolase [archaeon]